jgi:AraC-like DNA-binding protein
MARPVAAPYISGARCRFVVHLLPEERRVELLAEIQAAVPDTVETDLYGEFVRRLCRHPFRPPLTPAKTAAALKTSVRQLHLLFEPSGTSFAQYVLRRRREECRASLTSAVGDRSVSNIALGWGFNSLATFHRNFRQAFGASPGELRGRPAQPGASPAPTH